MEAAGLYRTRCFIMRPLMALPKKIEWVTFDVYGTLIDWEDGIFDAFSKEADRDGFTIERDQLIPLFIETEKEIEGGSYELYAEVLRRAAVRLSRELEWPLEPSRSGFLPDSVQRWRPFRETNPTLEKLKKKFQIGLISNIDDKLLGQTRRHMPVDSTSSSPRSRCAPTSPTRPTSPRPSGAWAPRRAGSTWARPTTTTSSRP